jgi:hypothetical protein
MSVERMWNDSHHAAIIFGPSASLLTLSHLLHASESRHINVIDNEDVLLLLPTSLFISSPIWTSALVWVGNQSYVRDRKLKQLN